MHNNRWNCTDCGDLSPETQTPYTLISSRYGWRVIFDVDDEGQRIPKWRCPQCWDSYKKAKSSGGARDTIEAV